MKIEINSCGQIFVRANNYLITFSGIQELIRPFGYFCIASFNLSRMEYEKLFFIEPDLTGDSKMKLPRGRYNGQVIDGFEVKFQLTLLHWKWVYIDWWSYGFLIFHFACFKIWVQWHYATRNRR
jgi:hypothetical protein